MERGEHVMTGIEVARKVAAEGVHVFRPRKDAPGEYDAKPFFSGSKRGWVALDAFSASAIVAIYDKLNETNRAKYGAMPLQKMAVVAFKLVK
jgi:hypothetical protein